MYTIIALFAETILFKLWSHRDICYPWHIYSFNGYWCSSVSFYWLPISMLSCQEPCSSVALHGLLYEENWDSNSPSPLVVTTELSKIINRNHAFMILEFPSSSLLLFYWGGLLQIPWWSYVPHVQTSICWVSDVWCSYISNRSGHCFVHLSGDFILWFCII